MTPTSARPCPVALSPPSNSATDPTFQDFRSENGLYSLIQDQFERAEASSGANPSINARKDAFEDRHVSLPPPALPAAAAAAAASTTNAFDIDQRPPKRRRTGEAASSPSSVSSPSPSPNRPQDTPPSDTSPVPWPDQQGPKQEHVVVAAAPLDPSQRVTRSRATALRPTLPRHLTQQSSDSSTSHDSIFSDQPPCCDSPQTDTSAFADTPRQPSFRTRPDTPPQPVIHVTSSSPLSSPPPDLFDPYENANCSTDSSSQEDSDCLDTSELDDALQSSDFFSSHASSSNIRNMKGRDLFDCNIWADPLKTSVFYRFATSLRQRVKEVEPTITHRFIAQMRDVGKLARVYTQNIDEIEKKIGLSTDLKHGLGNRKRKSIKQQHPEPSEEEEATGSPDDAGPVQSAGAAPASQKSEEGTLTQSKSRSDLSPGRGVECVFLHGSLHSLRCFVCGKLCDWDEDGRESCTLSGEQPECPHCAGATAARLEKGKRALGIGKLRPDIVLYGEEHPQSDLISPLVQHDLAAGPDLLLVLGTSLRVHGLKVMVKEFARAVHKKGGKVVFINFTKPSESVWGDILDYWIEWDCDAWVEDLKTRKPLLWLSPDERIELDRQRRETLAEKKREASKKRDSLGATREIPPEQRKTRAPPKNPVAMRNDYHCGAYIVWDIFQTLARIGNRPFDNLGYAQAVSSSPTHPPAPGLPSCHSTGRRRENNTNPQTRPKVEKRNKKPPARRASTHGPKPRHQHSPDESNPIPGNLSKSTSLSSGTAVCTVPADPLHQQQSTASSQANKRPAKKKRTRKSAPATFAANAHVEPERKPMDENKCRERHTSKDRYLQAARELARSRKTPTLGHFVMSNRPPGAPVHVALGSEPHTLGGSHLSEQTSADESNRRLSTPYTLYSFQPWIIPVPDPPNPVYDPPTHHPISIPTTEHGFSQGPLLPPLHDNWEQSPLASLVPMEITPFIGPASPLAQRGPSLGQPHFAYNTWHDSTQPIYNDPLVGISCQTMAAAQKPQWHTESTDDNTPSPSDQLRMEAANQLRQLQKSM